MRGGSDRQSPTAILMLSCPDRVGLVAAVAEVLATHGGNIVHADQHTDQEEGVFFQRVEFELDGFALDRNEILPALGPLLERYEMDHRLRFSDEVPRLAVLVSRQPHCLYDLLARWRTGELQADIPLVVSNHPDHADSAEHFGVEYRHLPVTPETKPAQEAAMLALLEQHDVEVIVLARYMQILSGNFVARYPDRIINIHHSFLPAFAGGRPYHQAYDRGVKIDRRHRALRQRRARRRADHRPGRRAGEPPRHRRRPRPQGPRPSRRSCSRGRYAPHLGGRVLVYGNKTVVFE